MFSRHFILKRRFIIKRSYNGYCIFDDFYNVNLLSERRRLKTSGLEINMYEKKIYLTQHSLVVDDDRLPYMETRILVAAICKCSLYEIGVFVMCFIWLPLPNCRHLSSVVSLPAGVILAIM